MAWIYILENKINKKCYVGQTVNTVNERISGHIHNKESYGSIITKALNKYGLDNFNIYKFECDEEDLDYFEIGFIKTHNSLVPNGYNVESGGNKNKHLSEKTKIKLRIAHKGKQAGVNHPMYGRHHSDKTKKQISESKKINPFIWTDELRKKYSKNMSGSNNPFYGKKHPPEIMNKISKKHIGLKHTEETKNKMRLSHLGDKSYNAIKVICIETGEIFNTITEAGNKYNIWYIQISYCCKKIKNFKTAGGYHWEYIK
jgi:hypothetical protein